MLEGKDLIVATNAYAAESKLRSWWYVLSTLAIFIGFEVAIYFSPYLWLTICLSAITGLLLVRLFVIYHDHQHGAILRESKMGKIFMWCYGVFSLAANSVWKSSHNYHHQHNSKLRGAHIGSYPIMTKEKYVKKKRSSQLNYLFMRHPLTMLFGYFFIFILGMCIGPFKNKPKQHFDCFLSLVVHAALYAVAITFLGWQAAMFMIFIPFFVMSAACAYAFYAQHNFPGVQFVKNSDWTYVGAALESTSFMKMSFVMHWFSANIGYHHIHHLNARIPFYRLPEVMAKFEELQKPRCTSLMPWEVWRCLRLKVWDGDVNALVPLSAIKNDNNNAAASSTATTASSSGEAA